MNINETVEYVSVGYLFAFKMNQERIFFAHLFYVLHQKHDEFSKDL